MAFAQRADRIPAHSVAHKPKTYHLRCYVAPRASGRFVAVCLKPNLVAEGASEPAARRELETLIDVYMRTAADGGLLQHFMSLRAPLPFYVEYFMGRLKKALRVLKLTTGPSMETCNIARNA